MMPSIHSDVFENSASSSSAMNEILVSVSILIKWSLCHMNCDIRTRNCNLPNVPLRFSYGIL